jgi:hypothetical protein
MNVENLTHEEIKTLHTLFGKLLEEPKQKVYLDPANKYIDDIILNFNFDKVHLTMEALNWKWSGSSNGIPTIDELISQAKRLLRGAIQSRLHDYKDSHWELGIINATGGFQATAFCDKTKTRIVGLDLKFVVNEWDEGEDEE